MGSIPGIGDPWTGRLMKSHLWPATSALEKNTEVLLETVFALFAKWHICCIEVTGAFTIPQAIANVFADMSSWVSVTPQGHARSLLSILDLCRGACVNVCLCVLPCRQFETVIPTEDSVITEITMTLRDWGTMWKQLYMVNITLCVTLNKCNCQ